MINAARRQELAKDVGKAVLADMTSAFWVDTWTFSVALLVNEDVAELRKILASIEIPAANLGFDGIAKAAATASRNLRPGICQDFGALQAVMLRTCAAIEGTVATSSLRIPA